METTSVTWAAPGARNQDFVAAGEHFAFVIDGATPEPDTDSGCVHGVPWLVTELGTSLFAALARDHAGRVSLPELLRSVLVEVGRAHRCRCDLGNPRSPSATLALLREHDGQLEHLVLGDSAVLFTAPDGAVEVVADRRMDEFGHLSWADLRHLRNTEGGFWVAGNTPDAALRAYTGSRPAADTRHAALLTDGAYRLVDRFGGSWRELSELLATAGPAAVLARTREAEARSGDGVLPGKQYDDATIALCHPTHRNPPEASR